MARLRALMERARRADAFTKDLLLGVVLAAIAIPALVASRPAIFDFRDPDLLALALILLQTLPVAWRRTNPPLSVAATGLAITVYSVLGYPDTAAGLGVLIALYSLAAHRDQRASLIAGGAAMVGLTVSLLTARGPITVDAILSNYAIFITAVVFGRQMRIRRAHTKQLEQRAKELEARRQTEARQAVSEERHRIARELHDVVAHNVSVMVVQAGAARRVLDSDVDRSREALSSIETTGRRALAEMRLLLGVLREPRLDEPSPVHAPQPSIGALGELVDKTRSAGLPVTVTIEGEARPLPQGVDLSAYRIVQEALTNALKHAGPARAEVLLRYGAGAIEIEVTDDGSGAASRFTSNGEGEGHGLVGMRERVAMFGGELVAAPRRGGGFRVRATLPLEAERI